MTNREAARVGVDELLPCPFCGKPGKYEERTEYEHISASEAMASGMGYSAGGFSRTITKVRCGDEAGESCCAVSGYACVARWNRRAAARVGAEGFVLVPAKLIADSLAFTCYAASALYGDHPLSEEWKEGLLQSGEPLQSALKAVLDAASPTLPDAVAGFATSGPEAGAISTNTDRKGTP